MRIDVRSRSQSKGFMVRFGVGFPVSLPAHGSGSMVVVEDSGQGKGQGSGLGSGLGSGVRFVVAVRGHVSSPQLGLVSGSRSAPGPVPALVSMSGCGQGQCQGLG